MKIVLILIAFVLFIASPLLHMSFFAALLDIALSITAYKIVATSQRKLYERGQNEQDLGAMTLFLHGTGIWVLLFSLVGHVVLLFSGFQKGLFYFPLSLVFDGWFALIFLSALLSLFFWSVNVRMFTLSKMARIKKRELESNANKPTLADRLR